MDFFTVQVGTEVIGSNELCNFLEELEKDQALIPKLEQEIVNYGSNPNSGSNSGYNLEIVNMDAYQSYASKQGIDSSFTISQTKLVQESHNSHIDQSCQPDATGNLENGIKKVTTKKVNRGTKHSHANTQLRKLQNRKAHKLVSKEERERLAKGFLFLRNKIPTEFLHNLFPNQKLTKARILDGARDYIEFLENNAKYAGKAYNS